jgi:hypothetical protein
MKTRRLILLSVLVAALLAVMGAMIACGGGFDRQSKVDSVRLFTIKADKPYAKPGETVTLEALYTDARKDKPRPLKNYWIPVVCMNPRDDLYYLCFVPAGVDGGATFVPGGDASVPEGGAGGVPPGGADAGAGGILERIPTGTDLGPFLPQGNTFTFTMPANAIQPRTGTGPYGLAIIFNLLCAGKVILAERDPSGGPQQVPLQCVDEENQKLPPSDYVIGISRVYAYDTKTNTNPVIEKVTFDGVDVDIAKGIHVETCKGVNKRADCPEHKMGVVVSEASWEANPSETARGANLREQIWVAYYGDNGDFDNVARLLFDTTGGRISDSEIVWRAPYDPVDGTIWAVVHDNRGGAAWVVVPVRVRVEPPPDAGPPDASPADAAQD